jgi:hypothetical protein
VSRRNPVLLNMTVEDAFRLVTILESIEPDDSDEESFLREVPHKTSRRKLTRWPRSTPRPRTRELPIDRTMPLLVICTLQKDLEPRTPAPRARSTIER